MTGCLSVDDNGVAAGRQALGRRPAYTAGPSGNNCHATHRRPVECGVHGMNLDATTRPRTRVFLALITGYGYAMAAAPRTPAFRGRARERQVLDGLLDRVRGGESAVLVLRGEAGIGKTALMRYCARQAAHVIRPDTSNSGVTGRTRGRGRCWRPSRRAGSGADDARASGSSDVMTERARRALATRPDRRSLVLHWGPRPLPHACRPGFGTGATQLAEARS